jgi:hypothetical protein
MEVFMVKILMIASFTLFAAMAAFADSASFSGSIEQVLQDCGCGKGKPKK